MDRLSTRSLYFLSYFIYAVCSALIYFADGKFWIIATLYSICGILSTAITTLPYQMVAEYHENDEYKNTSVPGTQRGLGIDCSLLSSMFFLSQALISIFMSLIISALGNYSIIISGSLLAFIGCFWISFFMIFPK